MINWKDISELHAISKIEEILHRWFGVEVLYADEHGKIRSKQLDSEYDSENHFMNVQIHLQHGKDYLEGDLEKVNEIFEKTKDSVIKLDTYFPHVKGIAAKIEIGGEFQGSVWAYPFIPEALTAKEIKEIEDKLIEHGANQEDATGAIKHIKHLSAKDKEYLTGLVDLVADEIASFTTEISKRDERIHDLNSELGNKYRYHSMIGKSKKMQAIYNLLDKISASESSVFIQGDNGTGKELVAKAIHYYSPRKNSGFLAVNCSAFNDNLLDSELFGHVKGAFTGAIKDKKGVFEQAHGGTIFLDEIGDTSLAMQVKLLRVLQEGTFLPVGSSTPKKVDVRVITATNRNIKEMMSKSEFREDLYYRINVINVQIPSLRDRGEDIPLLIDYFLQRRCAESGTPTKMISKKCLEKLLDYPWPGNVRELENEIERLVVLAGDDKNIGPELLSGRILDFGGVTDRRKTGEPGSNVKTTGNLKDALEELEAYMIKEGLKRCNFNKSKLSRELGISRASLIMKVEKYELEKRNKAVGE